MNIFQTLDQLTFLVDIYDKSYAVIVPLLLQKEYKTLHCTLVKNCDYFQKNNAMILRCLKLLYFK